MSGQQQHGSDPIRPGQQQGDANQSQQKPNPGFNGVDKEEDDLSAN